MRKVSTSDRGFLPVALVTRIVSLPTVSIVKPASAKSLRMKITPDEPKLCPSFKCFIAMKTNYTLSLLLVPFLFTSSALHKNALGKEALGKEASAKESSGTEVDKPTGTYASVITPRAVLNKNMKGGLVRVTWSEIEPKPGQFDFTRIEQQIGLLRPNMNWTLAIHGGWTSTQPEANNRGGSNFRGARNDRGPAANRGPGNSRGRENFSRARSRPRSLSPEWLVSDLKAETFSMAFRGNPVEMPKYWDPLVQKRLKEMLVAVGNQYGTDPRLKLIYVPQMTSNGTEGHFNGVTTETLLQAAGINSRLKHAEMLFGNRWVKASGKAAQSVLEAFPNKAVAFEVHELLRSHQIPADLIKEFQKPKYENRVGIGMWWISGKTTYQGNVLKLLKDYQGDLYGQVIGRSDQKDRFQNGDYTSVFKQAQELGMRYIEPWNYEFENHTHDETLAEFNTATKAKYSAK